MVNVEIEKERLSILKTLMTMFWNALIVLIGGTITMFVTGHPVWVAIGMFFILIFTRMCLVHYSDIEETLNLLRKDGTK